MDQRLPFVTVEKDAARLARMKRNVLTCARLIDGIQQQRKGRPDRWAMLTATYREDVDWDPRHVSDLLRNARLFAKEGGWLFVYVWTLEMTRRGRPHYHVAMKLPAGVKLPKPDDAGWWPHGMTRVEFARNPVAYLAKYLSKVDSLDCYPKGARISGFGGLPPEAKRERRLWASPRYVRELFGEEADPFRAQGGGWLDRETGEHLPSRYQVVSRGRRQVQLLDLWEGKDVPPGWEGPTPALSAPDDAQQ